MGEVVQLIIPKTEEYYQGKAVTNMLRYGTWKQLCRELEIRDVLGIVTEVTGVTLGQMRSSRRVPEYVAARQLFALLCVEHTKASYPSMGRAVNRDHTSMMHLVKKEQSHGFQKVYKEASKKVDQFKERVFGPPIY